MGCITSYCSQGTYDVADALERDAVLKSAGSEVYLEGQFEEVDSQGNPMPPPPPEELPSIPRGGVEFKV